MQATINKELLFLYWSGLATPMQRQLIREWLTQSNHQELFYQLLVEWEEQHPQSKPDSDQAWTRLMTLMEAPDARLRQPVLEQPVPALRRVGFRSPTWWLAASLVLTMGLGWLFRNVLLYNTYQTAFAEVLPVRLADGSVVMLNANSQLRVLRPWLSQFAPGGRVVWLRGEANFKVAHLPNHQRFVVRTDPLDVVVLGTEFVVTARSKQFRVALHTGKVELRSITGAKQAPVALRPGDVFTQPVNQQASLRHRQPTRQLTLWQSHEYAFDHTTLPEVLTLLQDQFGVRVALAHDSLATVQITGRFRADRAEDLLMIVTELTGYRLVERRGIKVLLPN